ncbi:hypothetical protein OIE68_17055 [Nocardia vinacea]|uniref:hypothetical protein n=1 Tax=Nocardia vinacea TaxID=96468 RepID=UPI002E140304|nr:hypothetical protein OIE68_17055 [Nocardia vinacea]
MNPLRAHRIGVVALLAFTGALAVAGLLACSGQDANGSAQPSATVTVTAPTGLRWQSFQGVDLPVADQGPERIEGPVASGFDRSPVGAALAAIHSTVRMSIGTDSQWPTVGQRMLAEGPGRDTWATARAQISITAPITSGAPKVAGYVIAHYTLDATDVDIYTIHPDNSITRNNAHVLWQGGDWRLHLPGNATLPLVTTAAVLPADIVSFTPR